MGNTRTGLRIHLKAEANRYSQRTTTCDKEAPKMRIYTKKDFEAMSKNSWRVRLCKFCLEEFETIERLKQLQGVRL